MLDNTVPKLGEYKYPYPKNKPTTIGETQNGFIIELEGLDGSGKSSQVKQLVQNLSEVYKNVFYVNFIHSEFIKDILLKTKWENCDINTFSLMYLMGLSNTYYREIIPRLKEGYIVVLDRYIYTIISKNLVSNEIKDDIWINECLKIFRKPDIKIFIDTPIEECLRRKKLDNEYLSYWECGGNIFYNEKLRQGYDILKYSENFLKYQKKIHDVYHKYIMNEGDWMIFDGMNSKEEISKQILNSVIAKLGERNK